MLNCNVAPHELASVRIITLSQPSSNHSLVMNWFHSAAYTPDNIRSCNSLSMVSRLVAAGHAAAVLSPAIMRTELDAGLIHVLNMERPITQQGFFVAYQEECLSGADTILELAKEVLARSRVLIPVAGATTQTIAHPLSNTGIAAAESRVASNERLVIDASRWRPRRCEDAPSCPARSGRSARCTGNSPAVLRSVRADSRRCARRFHQRRAA